MMLRYDMKVVTADCHPVRVLDIVIERRRLVVTHLVVSTQPWNRARRLVPMAAVAGRRATDGREELTVTMTRAHLLALEPVEQTWYVEAGFRPDLHDAYQVAYTRMQSWPYYSAISRHGAADWVERAHTAHESDHFLADHHDAVPAGTDEVGRRSLMLGRDSHRIGIVQGFQTTDEHVVSHVLVRRGHGWHRREVAVPAVEIRAMRDEVVLMDLDRDQAAALPSRVPTGPAPRPTSADTLAAFHEEGVSVLESGDRVRRVMATARRRWGG